MSGGCPVKQKPETPADSACPVMHPTAPAAESESACPVMHPKAVADGCDSTSLSSKLSDFERVGDEFPDAKPVEGQKAPLSTSSVHSTIPKGGEVKEGEETWTYPSPQRFYNAMKKKGWEPKESEMPTIVKIHNAVNERAWAEVMKYEQFHLSQCPNPKLLRFKGRPTEPSLKAQLLTWTGRRPPYDRHDWVVDRCGTEVGYIVDFYEGRAPPGSVGMPTVFLDTRPAPSVGGYLDLVRFKFKQMWGTS